mmetsp:Transcript_31771/g.57513  ORF Transcript_31771/g.57513 Transcript_31771/m.57513 type:complete len:102 (-) Transcript_31771:191-496(-)
MDSWSAKARAFGPYKRQQSLESVRLHHFHILIFPPLSSLCGWVRFIVFAAAIILTTCSLSDSDLLNVCWDFVGQHQRKRDATGCSKASKHEQNRTTSISTI